MINRRTVLTGAALAPFVPGVAVAGDAPNGLYLLPPAHWSVSIEGEHVLVGAMVRKISGISGGCIHWISFDPKNQNKYRDRDGNRIFRNGDSRYPRIDDHDKDVVGVVVYDENGMNYKPYGAA